jgi:hypothetical protein
MRFIPLLTVIFLFSCESKKEKIADSQEAIQEEMAQVKATYYKSVDSLESIQKADTLSAKTQEILGILEKGKNATLIMLQKEYDSLDAELKKY